jgi:hypothetical protein
MNVFTIPLVSAPQTLQITMVGVSYILTVYWCWPAGCWMLDISLSGTGVGLARGLPLVTGVDLLEQLDYLGVGGQLIVQTDTDALAAPTFDNLGSTAQLYFVPAVA